jgi:nuclear pore complex protein Nup155
VPDYLIEQLELRCFQLRLTQSPVPDALVGMNLDADLILDSYLKIVAKNDRLWLTDYDELFLMRSVKRVLNLILQNNFENSRNR